jgi:hypothetical protein
LPFVLRNTAVVNATMGRSVALDATVINAPVGLARCLLPLCWAVGLRALCGMSLLVLLARLMLLPLLTSALLFTLLPVLGEGDCGGSEQY